MDFGVRGYRRFHRSKNGMLPSKKALLDSTWLLSSIHWIWRLGWLAGLAGMDVEV